ncbi:MAG: hypothetical protein II119_04240 [Bacilli bacterium]|nr:hypothetical protein [Bacilli bacterium]
MKRVVRLLCALLVLLPVVTFAAENKSLNLEEVLKEEEIESKLGNYKESDEKATVYLFRGKGCGYCRGFINFLNDNIDELGKYFNLVSYEVWNDADNADLMQEVANFTGVAAQGVPYIVVGEKVFDGFTEEYYGEEFKAELKKLYDSEERYDVFEAMEKAELDAKKAENANVNKIILWNAVFSVVTICAVGLMLYMSNKKMAELIDSKIKIKNYVQQAQSEAPKKAETKKPVKKAKKK